MSPLRKLRDDTSKNSNEKLLTVNQVIHIPLAVSRHNNSYAPFKLPLLLTLAD
jgi:hypothetical protein